MKKIFIVIGITMAALLLMKGLAPSPCKECGPKGALSMVRSALQVYYGDNEGLFPADDLACLTAGGKYLPQLPLLWDPASHGKYAHPPTREVVVYAAGEPLRDTGKWAYFSDPLDKASWGNFVIDCTHDQVLRGNGLFSGSRASYPWSTF